ncbi:PREDICTED: probable polygalacturonase At1g80170 [Nicotiana attenuata]|uniref:endo-polygalacturonase n=1 Tax=Nicotiana attenuata TaxID=49451 RepID=A0A1J6IRX0_NICAT|nr:PREDICTED: probable polygalacturonase At1g80170 [Nicotiana attenuata]OIT01571.1 putative polygalacturonase [Nicotiana attenuata]
MCSSNSSYTMKTLVLLFILGLTNSRISCASIIGYAGSFNVLDYGASGDGITDDSQAFLNAWNDACSSAAGYPEVIIPPNMIFLLSPLTLRGPCNSESIYFVISGRLVAPSSPGIWTGQDASQWLAFRNVSSLIVDGSGTIDGQGRGWWDQSCGYHPDMEGCTRLAPTALKFIFCSQSSISNIYFSNSAQTHILIERCNGFKVDSVMIQSPGNSPNTDGIHIQSSRYVAITNSKISSGDDCISIGDYTSNVQIYNIQCGPGHGISIGSLGKGGNFAQVENIHVSNAFFYGTTNGARIKTWQVGRGYVRDVIFENLEFNSVKNPIIIDQNYCDVRGACKEMVTGVQISNVIYQNIFGTSSTDIAINLNCSMSVPCTDITMQLIQLTSATPGTATPGREVTAYCRNAYGQEYSIEPGPCISEY